jgi:1,4-dihydroxy-2-naphthoate octaprenyltransferase
MSVVFQGMRIKTLSASFASVFLGATFAYKKHTIGNADFLLRAFLCLLTALFIQIFANFINDYLDSKKGIDKERAIAKRLTMGESPKTILTISCTFAFLACCSGFALLTISNKLYLLPVGALCILVAYFYSGGKRPYGHNALGEVFVFIFFGLVAVCGTFFVLSDKIDLITFSLCLFLGCIQGLITTSLLLVDNIRDIDSDKRAGKRTLSTYIGKKNSIKLAYFCASASILCPILFAFHSSSAKPLIAYLYLPFLYLFIQATHRLDYREMMLSQSRLSIAFSLLTGLSFLL